MFLGMLVIMIVIFYLFDEWLIISFGYIFDLRKLIYVICKNVMGDIFLVEGEDVNEYIVWRI